MLALLAALAAVPAPVAAAPATYDIDLRVSCGLDVIKPHLVTEEGRPVAMVIDPTGRQGWSVKVTPSREGARVRLELETQVWALHGGGKSSGAPRAKSCSPLASR